MSQTVAEILIGVLEQIGVKHIFGLIGDSLNPLADAVRRSKIEWIGVRHEEGAALAAAGQAKLTGRLGVCAGTTGTRQHASCRRALRSEPRPRARPRAFRRHAAQDARHRLHPDDGAESPVPRRLTLYRDHFYSRASARRHPSGDRCRLCGPWRRPFDAAARRHQCESRRRRVERRNLEAAPGNCRERGRHRRDRAPRRRSRQCRHHVRRRMPRRRRRITRAFRPAQSAAHPFRQRQGHHALRRAALDGRHRHDRHQGGLQRRHALRSAADARHRLSVFGIPAAQGRRHPDRRPGARSRAAARRPRSASSARCARRSNCCSIGSRPRATRNSGIG